MLITDTADFSPPLMFICGQCFRFLPVEDGIYSGIAYGKKLTLATVEEGVRLNCTQEDYDLLWRRFFDMDTDYAVARQRVSITPFMCEAVEFGQGIRILRQDFWEAVCSFVISQCNNIKRIQGIISKLCSSYGERVNDVDYAFPDAAVVASLSVNKLRELGVGYRAPFIIAAANAVVTGEISAEKLNAMDYDGALRTLCGIEGIGAKVANCILLYGTHRMDAFPVDVWMKRAINEHFPKEFDPAVFGEYAGIAQQYIFHYMRSLHTR